jgi:5-amino-6-(5-phosphoribosylamino)uracil reductase
MRPRVLINMAPSLDGKIAPARRSGVFAMSRHPEDRKRMREIRALADAVLIGAANLRADNPDLMPSRLRVVVTRNGEGIDPTARLFNPELGGEAIVAHAATMPESTRQKLSQRATLVEFGATDVDMAALLRWLFRERDCRVLLAEGGGVLNAELLRVQAFDELYMTLVPRILGGAHAPSMVSGLGFDAEEIPDAKLASCERIGSELFLKYEFSWPDQIIAQPPAKGATLGAAMNANIASEPEIDAGTVVLRVVVENPEEGETGSVFICRMRGFEDVTVEAFPEGLAPAASGESRAAAAEAVSRYASENRERLEQMFAVLSSD